MLSERNAPKNGEPTVGFSFTTMLKQNGRVLVKDFLANNNVTVLEHPPHSPALVPTDVYLFPQMKSALKGWVFGDTTDIIKNATVELKRLSKLLPGKVSNTFTVAGRSVQFQKGGLFRRICILNNCIFCIVLYFSELN